MRKISELSADEFFDVLYALTPILHSLEESEFVKLKISNANNQIILRSRNTMRRELGKLGDKKDVKALEHITQSEEYLKAKSELDSEIARIFVSDISRILPKLLAKENRSVVYEIISILDETSITDVKTYPAAKLVYKVRRLLSDTDLKDFLSYAEQSEQKA